MELRPTTYLTNEVIPLEAAVGGWDVESGQARGLAPLYRSLPELGCHGGPVGGAPGGLGRVRPGAYPAIRCATRDTVGGWAGDSQGKGLILLNVYDR